MKLNHILLLIAVPISSVAMTQIVADNPRTRYFDADQNAKPAGATHGVYSMVCFYKGDWIASGGSELVFNAEKKTVRFKNELEKTQSAIPSKITALYQSAQGYIKSRGYDEVTLMRMAVYLTTGNDAQKALAGQVLQFTDIVTAQGDYIRKGLAEVAITRQELKDISLDYTNFNDIDPKITLIDIGQAK